MSDEFSYPLIRRAIVETPWAILPEKLDDIMALVALKAAGGTLTPEEIRANIGAAAKRPAPRTTRGDIGVLQLMGTISKRMGLMAQSSGGTSTEALTQDFRAMLADASIGAIVLDVDSPGGTVPGIEELSAEIYAARGKKPIVAVANDLAASAAYWLASAADEFLVTPSGQVGSIGVLAAHEDRSALYDKMGVKISLVSAGKYKAENNPFEPMTEEGRAAIQKRVDETYGMFVRAVARNRGVSVDTVRNGFGEGRVVGAKEAVKLGMADRIGTLDDAIRSAGRRAATATGNIAALDLDSPMSLPEQSATALTAVELFHARIMALTSMRRAQGKPPVAEANIERIAAHIAAYDTYADAYRALLAEVQREPEDAPAGAADALLLDFLALDARRLGVLIP